jgi:hypothetical protein
MNCPIGRIKEKSGFQKKSLISFISDIIMSNNGTDPNSYTNENNSNENYARRQIRSALLSSNVNKI